MLHQTWKYLKKSKEEYILFESWEISRRKELKYKNHLKPKRNVSRIGGM